MTINLAILGSTGSIGQQTLEVVEKESDKFNVFALAAGANIDLLNKQIGLYAPQKVAVANPSAIKSVQHNAVLAGEEGLVELVTNPAVDIVVVATPGRAGLMPTLAAIREGKKIALSNKEVLVMAGEIVMAEAKKYGAEILPVDSEHSAIWQCLQGENHDNIEKLWITASGGAFRNYPKEKLKEVTSAQALEHPNWKMGKKVTIDSATLMNKGFEIIEARWLFNIPYEKISPIIHYESIIHSMVEFSDGSIKAQMGMPDMRLPIQYALNYPDRTPINFLPMQWHKYRTLHFADPDYDRFPALALAMEAGKAGGTYPAVLSAADEIVVDAFIENKIAFTAIPEIIKTVLDSHTAIANPTLDDIFEAERWAREKTISRIGR